MFINDATIETLELAIESYKKGIEFYKLALNKLKNSQFIKGSVVYNKEHGVGLVTQVLISNVNDSGNFPTEEDVKIEYKVTFTYNSDRTPLRTLSEVDLLPYTELTKTLYTK